LRPSDFDATTRMRIMKRMVEQTSGEPAFERLCRALGQSFPAIAKARKRAVEELAKLSGLAANGGEGQASSPDTSIVVFGSLARREWTVGSDVDWTLLIDSPADLLHQTAAQEFERRLVEANYAEPGPERVFGGLSFSHDLIHWIGGERDTNQNVTRRLLLLLESTAVARPDVLTRVVRGILHRYVDGERSFLAETGRHYKVPRFLLNDVVRYWRTMAVDYASKRWERGDKGWALRNMKLRFSRKLMFASGLLVCFSCRLDEPHTGAPELFKDEEEAKQKVHQHVAEKLGTPPLDVLCAALLSWAKPETAQKTLAAYDAFLAALDSSERDHLTSLDVQRSHSDDVFKRLRGHSQEFQLGLRSLFLEEDPLLCELTKRYGLF
jgi:predicted nucleotidyltransferase